MDGILLDFSRTLVVEMTCWNPRHTGAVLVTGHGRCSLPTQHSGKRVASIGSGDHMGTVEQWLVPALSLPGDPLANVSTATRQSPPQPPSPPPTTTATTNNYHHNLTAILHGHLNPPQRKVSTSNTLHLFPV
ncbi:hypothetical protein E2C01_072972 [Portunus trituberculatus]|uniref:Uncharacterized protein n=1 Tax=Portunus trituberculatus TaxID=210409 RepID=A0A5B7I8M2_PORTR|nr:hypothetical protein [Portunus trituberculatus]